MADSLALFGIIFIGRAKIDKATGNIVSKPQYCHCSQYKHSYLLQFPAGIMHTAYAYDSHSLVFAFWCHDFLLEQSHSCLP